MDDFDDMLDGGLDGTRPELSATARVCRFRWASRP